MRSRSEAACEMQFAAAAPLAVLPPRTLLATFPVLAPLLRALGDGEQPATGIWSDWLASWGWAWTVSQDACRIAEPLAELWATPDAWPPTFDARALALAIALRLKVDGRPLGPGSAIPAFDLQRVWHVIASLPQESLGQVLALALLRADREIFDFASVCPQWPADVTRVIAERRALADEREPAPAWLRTGYAMLGGTFELLRSEGKAVGDCEFALADLAARTDLPSAFEMAFWWEAAYCLTERHAYADAEEAQLRVSRLATALEVISGLVDPLWHHQQGRLYYYAGNHESALAEFLREFKSRGDDLAVIAMLEREMANVLSDLTCLDAAANFAESSVAHARQQGQKAELYKSLGRLAEIFLKQGKPAQARQSHEESLAIQERLGGNRAPAQTMTYLGHVALLQRDFDAAAAWYDKAETKDREGSSTPYLTMGRFALAFQSGNAVDLDQLWNARNHEIATWTMHPTHVLPAAVCVLAASRRRPEARAMLPEMIRSLIDRRYPVEAIRAAAELSEGERGPLVRDAISILHGWQKALSALPPGFRDATGALNGPTQIIEIARKHEFTQEALLNQASYPLCLALPDSAGESAK
jgi:tetratricopeptide (TPR) repeat protein